MLVFTATLWLDKPVGKLLTAAQSYNWFNPLSEYWNCGHSPQCLVIIWLQIELFTMQFSYKGHVKNRWRLMFSWAHNASHPYINIKLGIMTWGYCCRLLHKSKIALCVCVCAYEKVVAVWLGPPSDFLKHCEIRNLTLCCREGVPSDTSSCPVIVCLLGLA